MCDGREAGGDKGKKKMEGEGEEGLPHPPSKVIHVVYRHFQALSL